MEESVSELEGKRIALLRLKLEMLKSEYAEREVRRQNEFTEGQAQRQREFAEWQRELAEAKRLYGEAEGACSGSGMTEHFPRSCPERNGTEESRGETIKKIEKPEGKVSIVDIGDENESITLLRLKLEMKKAEYAERQARRQSEFAERQAQRQREFAEWQRELAEAKRLYGEAEGACSGKQKEFPVSHDHNDDHSNECHALGHTTTKETRNGYLRETTVSVPKPNDVKDEMLGGEQPEAEGKLEDSRRQRMVKALLEEDFPASVLLGNDIDVPMIKVFTMETRRKTTERKGSIDEEEELLVSHDHSDDHSSGCYDLGHTTVDETLKEYSRDTEVSVTKPEVFKDKTLAGEHREMKDEMKTIENAGKNDEKDRSHAGQRNQSSLVEEETTSWVDYQESPQASVELSPFQMTYKQDERGFLISSLKSEDSGRRSTIADHYHQVKSEAQTLRVDSHRKIKRKLRKPERSVSQKLEETDVPKSWERPETARDSARSSMGYRFAGKAKGLIIGKVT